VTFEAIDDIGENLQTLAVNAELVNMWRSAIMKARQQQEDQKPQQEQVCALIMNFDGSGLPLIVGMGGIPQIPPGAFRLVGIKLAAGAWSSTQLKIIPVTVTCSVDVSLATSGSWSAGSRAMYDSRPALTNQSEISIDPATWLITDIQPGDMVAFTLASFSGQATVLTVTLSLRRIDVIGVGAPTLTDEGGDAFTDASGRPYFSRGG
jgi:hypothetical protein